MSALDKSLDEILSDKPKKSFKKRAPVAKSKVSKAVVPKKAAAKKAAPAKPAATVALDASYATKVIVYGLPKDIKYDAVKVGGVSNVMMQYNDKGQSRGVATVSFKNSQNASKAVEKYNGAPIDGGVQKLRLELVIDPTKKPLANRIIANAGPAKKVTPKKKATPAAPAKKADKPKDKKPKKSSKKTIEQLDQEMADYFEK